MFRRITNREQKTASRVTINCEALEGREMATFGFSMLLPAVHSELLPAVQTSPTSPVTSANTWAGSHTLIGLL